MPSRNSIKQYAPHSYYHVYNRGVNKQPIFHEAADKAYLLKLFKRHLDPCDKSIRTDGLNYEKYNQQTELLAYCFMNNHYHLLLYLHDDQEAISKLLQSVFTAYTMYFNKKYKRSGTLFQGVYKGSRIDSDAYLLHITRYIHMNPRHYKTYYYSSVQYYLNKPAPHWINTGRVLALFDGSDYLSFLEDYEGQKEIQDELKLLLANK
jgi:REP element-mobilizing transposase RayT